jgi:hypothetical protein
MPVKSLGAMCVVVTQERRAGAPHGVVVVIPAPYLVSAPHATANVEPLVYADAYVFGTLDPADKIHAPEYLAPVTNLCERQPVAKDDSLVL